MPYAKDRCCALSDNGLFPCEYLSLGGRDCFYFSTAQWPCPHAFRFTIVSMISRTMFHCTSVTGTVQSPAKPATRYAAHRASVTTVAWRPCFVSAGAWRGPQAAATARAPPMFFSRSGRTWWSTRGFLRRLARRGTLCTDLNREPTVVRRQAGLVCHPPPRAHPPVYVGICLCLPALLISR